MRGEGVSREKSQRTKLVFLLELEVGSCGLGWAALGWAPPGGRG